MRAAHLDDAASAPQTGLPGPAAQAEVDAARLWRRMRRWVGQLARIGADLTQRMGWVADFRERTGTTTDGSFDLRLGWALVARAARWTRALRARMREAAASVRAEDEEAPERFPDLDISRSVPARGLRPRPVAAPASPREGYQCIDGLTAAEVVAQVCADLADAATLLRAVRAGKAIARIAAAVRKLLAQQGKTWTKLPPKLWGRARDDAAPTPQDAPIGLSAPDTG